MGRLDALNARVKNSAFGRFYEMEERGAEFTTDVLAGTITFLTMAYIIPVNSGIIADTGGPCVSQYPGASFFDDPPNQDFLDCVDQVRKDILTVTCVVSCLACTLSATISRLPIMQMPGMGMNAYFAYTVVGFNGSGNVTYDTALAAVIMEGIIFFILAVTGLRSYIAAAFPKAVRASIAGGIGFFLAIIGLQASQGLGVVTGDDATLVELGGCPEEYREFFGTGGAYICTAKKMHDKRMWLGIGGATIIALLMCKGVKGAIIVGILFVSIISWFRGTAVTYFPNTEDGDARFNYFKKVVMFQPIRETAGAVEFNLGNVDVWIALITFLYTDLLDTTGTLYSIAKQAGFLDVKTGDFKRSRHAFSCDACSTIAAGCLGSSPVVSAVESMAGIEAGGRTGIVPLTGAFWFFCAIFLNPIFASIPKYATGPALVIVGSLMMGSLRDVNWDYKLDAIPAFLTVILMPLTYSIAYGLVGGIGAAIVLHGLNYAWDICARKITFSDAWADIRGQVEENVENESITKSFRDFPGHGIVPSAASIAYIAGRSTHVSARASAAMSGAAARDKGVGMTIKAVSVMDGDEGKDSQAPAV